MKILLTAFEPFGGDSINPALEALKLVKDEICGAQIIKCRVPVVRCRSVETVRAVMEAERPDAVLCIGQAGGRSGLTPERVAVNVDDYRIPDNEGNQPIDEQVFPDGENAYFAGIPIKAMVRKIQESGVPAYVSNTAGTYVCNHLMYGVLYHIAKSFPGMRGGFIHVPFIREQVTERHGTPYLPLADIVTGIEAAVAAIVENDKDIAVTGGTDQ